jgi:1-acyl-sn-glycerol-3-phosphate acyltransferase
MIILTEQGITPEIKANQKIYTEHLEEDFPKYLVQNILDPIDKHYFRSRFIGFDSMPERNNPDLPLIFASNHSGMAFPWDALIFTSQLYKRNNFEFYNSVRALTAPMLSYSTLMNPYLVKNFWKRGGGVDATSLNFETMMYYKKSNLLIYPEGVPGIGKGFDKRYQLQKFSTSFIRISLKYRTDIVPFATVNGEYVNPYNLKSETLNRIVQKIGIPFLPVGFMTLLIPFQPWLFYFGFPAKLTYVMGKRIKPYEIVDKPLDKITEKDISHVTREVKKRMQEELDEAVSKYGLKPYEMTEMVRVWRKNIRKLPFFVPSFWPSLFAEFERSYRSRDSKKVKIGFLSGVKAFYHNPMTIAFFLPIIGWIPILIHGLKGRKKGLK